jgi:hypothetical protein
MPRLADLLRRAARRNLVPQADLPAQQSNNCVRAVVPSQNLLRLKNLVIPGAFASETTKILLRMKY